MTFRELVRSKGYTAKQLADAAGVSVRTVEAYYNGKRSIKGCHASVFMKFSELLDVSPKELLLLDGEKRS